MRKFFINNDGQEFQLRKGKMLAQAAHASSTWAIDKLSKRLDMSPEELNWISNGMTKIGLQVDYEEDLLNIYNKAKELNLTVNLIVDSGKTEFKGIPTKTCLAIGPNISTEIDKVTGNLKLL